MSEETIFVLLTITAIIIILILYFVPTFCAKDTVYYKKILILNIFLGWCPIIWLILLVCSIIGTKKV